jgi:phenylalanyl-tRNA synthetase beta chain
MKVPLKWLADYVPLSLPVAQLAERLTLAGLEVSGVRLFGLPHPEGLRVKTEEAGPVWEPDKVIVAEVVGVEKHPDADRLKLPTVAYGQGRTKTMVTGAPNLEVGDKGQKVIVGLTGCQYIDGHVSPPKLSTLKPIVMRGVPTDAMVMSSFELGIDEKHEGIIILEDDAPVGTPLADFMGDVVLEIDILPNMARCLSLIGIAREVSALTGQPLTLPVTTPKSDGPPTAGKVKVEIKDPDKSARYAAALIQGVKIGTAPGWMQRRLTYAGMRPISNVVDVTNYVMLEWGQPLHAFDYDVLVRRAGGKAPTIIVRPARPGEKLRTLDDVDRTLTPEVLVIADEAGAIALAGVMGGAETEVSDKTTNVLLESANFDFISIRRTMKELNLPSEASTRFSKGIHPEMVPLALGRACELLRLHAGGTVCQAFVDSYPKPLPAQVIELKSSEVRRILGIDLPIAECARILRALAFEVEETPDGLRATPPPHRLDIQAGAADLLEDIARLYGYDRIPGTLLRDELPPQTGNDELAFEERVRDRLVTCGLQEVVTYALTTPEREKPIRLPEGEYVRLKNPISAERTVMRRSLLASVLEVAARNLKVTDEVRLFELGSVYLPKPGQTLPEEPRRLAIVMCGKRGQEFWGDTDRAPVSSLDFYDLKGVIEALLADLHVSGATYRQAAVPALHPGMAAEVVAAGNVLGYLGRLHPRVAPAMDLADRAVLVAEVDLAALRAAVPSRHAYTPVPRFPAALRDVAVTVPENVSAARVEAEIRAAGGPLLREVRLFDLYRGESIPAGHKSLAYALTYLADDRTLKDTEVDKAHQAIEGRLRHVLQAEIRGRET